MSTRSIISGVLSAFLLLFLQVVLIKNLVLFDVAFCYIYVAILIYLPMNWNSINLMAMGLVIGFIVDSFYDTIGVHAAACVLLGFSKPYIFKMVTPIGGYENIVSYRELNIRWNITYATTLIAIHHIYLFILDAADFNIFSFTFFKLLTSIIFTLVAILIYRSIFFTSYDRE